MIGLQALSEFAELIYTPDIDFTVRLTLSADSNFQKTITVNQQNSMVLQLVEVMPFSHFISQVDNHSPLLVMFILNRGFNFKSEYKTIVCDHSINKTLPNVIGFVHFDILRWEEIRDMKCRRSHFLRLRHSISNNVFLFR